MGMGLSPKTTWTIGVISDTHGVLRPEAPAALEGVDHIIHAGDIGEPAILAKLAAIAPLTAVRGNIDRKAWARKIPESNILEVGSIAIYVLHNLDELDLNPKAAGFAAVVSGHTHQPKHGLRDGVLYFNPGSAGPRRFKLPITVGRLLIMGGKIESEVIELISS
jgi:putative phosphoesterase